MTIPRLPRVEDFSDRLRGPEVTSRVGLWLGIAFGVCFLTGFWSHLQQTTPSWLAISPNPFWLYRVTQGTHIIAGTIAVPLLLVKLWSVFPQFFKRPPKGLGRVVLDALERVSIAILVAAALFQLVIGLINVTQWYPWSFSFRSTHYAVGWLVIGALVLHIAVKLPVIREALASDVPEADDEVGDEVDEPVAEDAGEASVVAEGLSRRGLLRATLGASGLVALLTAGQTVPWLRNVSAFSVRTGAGPQGLPINRTAMAAGIKDVSGDPSWRLELVFGSKTMQMSRSQLEAMPQSSHDLPIACVEGWSAIARWTGVPMATMAALVGAPERSTARVSTLQTRGAFGRSELPAQFVEDERTLLALQLNGQRLSLDHGYPCRIIAPNRPGVWQTKWVNRLEFFA